jgi:hypothetical protein
MDVVDSLGDIKGNHERIYYYFFLLLHIGLNTH